MTEALATAIELLKSLPDGQQEAMARLVIQEIEEDRLWEATTAAHPERLAQIAAEVEAAYRRGECEPLDPETL